MLHHVMQQNVMVSHFMIGIHASLCHTYLYIDASLGRCIKGVDAGIVPDKKTSTAVMTSRVRAQGHGGFW